MKAPGYGPREDADGSTLGGDAQVYDSPQERNRVRKARKRERKFLARLEAGEVGPRELEAYNAARIRLGRCPIGCPCYDCTFGETPPPTRRAVRFTGGVA